MARAEMTAAKEGMTGSVEQALNNHDKKRRSKVAEWVKGLGIVGAVGGFMASVSGAIGAESGADLLKHHTPGQLAEFHDFANAFNGGLIAMAAGAGLWATGKFIEHRRKVKAQRK
jgi:hypothetical protein